MSVKCFRAWAVLAGLIAGIDSGAAVLNKQQLLEAETFWDNRDWEWYRANIPFFECPDREITTTWYYRWELVTKHLTYGSPASGYSFTEFIDRPFWSGAYGAISCPAGHQLYEVRWLIDPRYARDYARYWFRAPGAQPRNYSTWLADAVWAVHTVHPDRGFVTDLLPDLITNYLGWENRHFVPEIGLFWQIGHDDGMEYNINSRQTEDEVRGAPGFRPSFNAYMWADALAIARVAELAGDPATAARFREKAAGIKNQLQKQLWDPKREFFLQKFQKDEERDGFKVKAGTFTHQTGRYAGSPHGREEIGFVPWQFSLPDPGYESAWKFLMDPDYFFAEYGPTTVERHDPMFVLQKTCCWWSGQSWPYASTQTLKALANLLQHYEQRVISRADYLRLLRIYARSHRKEGRPYIAEALNPDTGSFEGHDSYNHSEHYFHSGYTDIIVTGLVGIVPASDDTLTVDPLAPGDWEYFAIDDLPYRGHLLAVLWDKSGRRYRLGPGLHVLLDGKEIAAAPKLTRLTAKVAARNSPEANRQLRFNYAVNNDGNYFPQIKASFASAAAPLFQVNDGHYWYHRQPPNRWSCEGSTNASDWLLLDFGVPRRIDTVNLYLADDGELVRAPVSYGLEYRQGDHWEPVPSQSRDPVMPEGHRANRIRFPALDARQIRVTFQHAKEGRTALSEIEAWGEGRLPFTTPPAPPGNLADNPRGEGFPKASASFSDQYGGRPELAIDGKVNFRPSPMNRWTSYGSTNRSDWLEIDFGEARKVGQVELYLYDDRRGVQAPADYSLQFWSEGKWEEVHDQVKSFTVPVGNQVNTVRFPAVITPRVRILFVHRGNARSGVTEVAIRGASEMEP